MPELSAVAAGLQRYEKIVVQLARLCEKLDVRRVEILGRAIEGAKRSGTCEVESRAAYDGLVLSKEKKIVAILAPAIDAFMSGIAQAEQELKKFWAPELEYHVGIVKTSLMHAAELIRNWRTVLIPAEEIFVKRGNRSDIKALMQALEELGRRAAFVTKYLGSVPREKEYFTNAANIVHQSLEGKQLNPIPQLLIITTGLGAVATLYPSFAILWTALTALGVLAVAIAGSLPRED